LHQQLCTLNFIKVR